MSTGRRIACWLLPSVCALAATAAPAVGPATIAFPSGADARSQLNPAVAHDGKGVVLVAWQQGRRYYEQQDGDILAVRLNASGKVLDANPILVSAAAGSQEAPQVRFANGVFLVVWQDFRSGTRWEVYAARIDANGRVLDPAGVPIGSQGTNAAQPQVAGGPDGFLVVWQALEGRYYQLRSASVATTGAVTAHPLARSGKPLLGGSPTIARQRSGWLLAWNDEHAWVVATGMVTRRAAWLHGSASKPTVADVETVPLFARNTSSARMFGAGDVALFAGWGIDGRGRRVAAAAIYRDGTVTALENPNGDLARDKARDQSRMLNAFPHEEWVDGPIAGDFGCGRFLLVTRTLPSRAEPAYRFVAMPISPAGRRLDAKPAVVTTSDTPIANPVLAFAGEAALLVYEQAEDSGRRVLRGRLLHDACRAR